MKNDFEGLFRRRVNIKKVREVCSYYNFNEELLKSELIERGFNIRLYKWLYDGGIKWKTKLKDVRGL